MLPTLLPVRRDLHFNLSQVDIKRWHAKGAIVSHFMNALSVFFPEGERFFMHSVRLYRQQITDPQLQQAVTAFIGQEAMHGREHEEYNDALDRAKLPASKLERIVTWAVGLFKHLPNSAQLAITIALEHFTAILADLLLREPRATETGCDRNMAALWRWHALEETEHKSVAYDVYRTVMGRTLSAYFLRTSVLLVISVLFMLGIFYFHLRMIYADKEARGVRQWMNLLSFLFGPVGALRRIALPWLDYFRPGFQPWDHDNRHFLAGIDDLVAEVQTFGKPVPLAA